MHPAQKDRSQHDPDERRKPPPPDASDDRPDDRPGARDRRKMVSEQDKPVLGRNIIHAVELFDGRRLSPGIYRKKRCDTAAVEKISQRKNRQTTEQND